MQEARESHTDAVKQRIDSVESMKDVVPLTKQLFELSRETAKLEAESFQTRQKVAIAAEAKAVLDSWVRFEQSQKAAEQDELVKSVVDNIMKNLGDEKVQKEVLAGAVAEVERECSPLPIVPSLSVLYRIGQKQGRLEIKTTIIEQLTFVKSVDLFKIMQSF